MSLDTSASTFLERLRPPERPLALDHYLLGGAPDDPALVAGGLTLTYAELRLAVEARAGDLAEPGLLVLPIGNDLASVVTYLAALALHRPVVLVEAGEEADLRRRDIVARYAVPGTGTGTGRNVSTPHHPDLALLLSTSGSTGSPKLVRLSRVNLVANARSIADYLELGPDDRAITSLPLHYCYGLSVLHAHLVAGAAVVLTDASVAEESFWDLVTRHRVTGLAGVPYTFDLLAASGFERRDLPSLRYVTQAGGRLDPDRVRALGALGERSGWCLFVMYGQTEATARMAYLPPSLSRRHPGSVGMAVPGGRFRLHRPDGDGIGELVYAGPNVMMGYAQDPADLARGSDLTELFTGDLARIDRRGLVEIVGRRDRVAKLFGLRLDLDRAERLLGDALGDAPGDAPGGSPGDRDAEVRLVVLDDVLHAFTARPRTHDRVHAHLTRQHGLPAAAVLVHRLAALPRTGAGKIDDAALRTQAEISRTQSVGAERAEGDQRAGGHVSARTLREVYAVLLGRPDAALDDTFVSLGGDSLSYVELSTRLSALLGRLPRDWPTRTPRELADGARPTPRSRHWSAPLEVGVLLRALAILIVVVTHVDLVLIPGGAHLLLAVAGYHLARFTLPTPGRRARTRRILLGVAGVAVPASLWIAASALVTGDYHWRTVLYLNWLTHVGRESGQRWNLDWQFWFLEAIVWGFLALAALLCVPAVDRWQRRAPFTVAAVAVGVTTALRYASVGVEGEGVERYAVPSVLFVLALGWAAAEARTTGQRLAVLAATYAGLAGYFDDRQRELIVVGTIALLLWLRPVAVPRLVAHPLRLIAMSSLWIYLTHWQVYPPLEDAGHPVAALLASLVVGICAQALYGRALARLRQATARPRHGRVGALLSRHAPPARRRRTYPGGSTARRESSRNAGPTNRS